MSLLSPQLQAFIAIVNAKTVHAAAGVLHITQTAVTQRLRNLEQHLKTTLFIRSRRGMVLTTEGEALLRYCTAALDLEGEALSRITGAGVQSLISLGISGPTSIMRSRVIPAMLPVMKAFPNLLLCFDISDTQIRLQHLRLGKCQFSIIREGQLAAEMKFKALKAESYVLVCASAWQGRKLKEIIKHERIVDYDPSDTMTFNYLKKYALFDLVRPERYFVNHTESLAMLVSKGLGYSILTEEFAAPYLKSGELISLNKGSTYEDKPILAWYDRPEPPAYFKAIIDNIE